MISAKDIKINIVRPPVPTTVSCDEQDNAAIFRGLRTLLQTSGDDKNYVADVLINALIDLGINTRSRIKGAASCLDCNSAHVVIRLNKGDGLRWKRNTDGTYRNLA